MDKKERKLLEEKIILAISETVKNNALQTSATFLKSVRKHSKAIAKKLVKEMAVPAKKVTAVKKKTASAKKFPAKKAKIPAAKKVSAKAK